MCDNVSNFEDLLILIVFLQTSLTGIELSFVTVMVLLSVEMDRMRLESIHY